MGEGFTGSFRRGRKQFVVARCNAPKIMQKPQSRGDAIIAMNCWLEILRSGAKPPVAAPN
jgi:hypothetical protein